MEDSMITGMHTDIDVAWNCMSLPLTSSDMERMVPALMPLWHPTPSSFAMLYGMC